MLLRHSWRFGIADTPRTRRHGYKPLDPCSLAANTIGSETPVINFFAELLIELETGIIGNTCQVNHSVYTPARIPQLAVSRIPPSIILRHGCGSIPPVMHDVVHRHIVAGRQQLRGQERADVAGASSIRTFFIIVTPEVIVSSPVMR